LGKVLDDAADFLLASNPAIFGGRKLSINMVSPDAKLHLRITRILGIEKRTWLPSCRRGIVTSTSVVAAVSEVLEKYSAMEMMGSTPFSTPMPSRNTRPFRSATKLSEKSARQK
jgi:hypothetical protein